MRKILFYCNRCGSVIDGEVHKLLDCIADPETGHYSDKHYAFNLGTSSLDFCDRCMVEIDRELSGKYMKSEEKLVDAAAKMKEVQKKREYNRKPLDMGKVKALRKAGWSFKAIAEEMGVSSPQTIANHLKEVENAEGDATE